MRNRWSLIGVLLVGLALLGGTVGSSAAQQVVTITAWAAGSPVDGTRCSNLVEAAGQLRSETGLKIEPACQFTHVQDWAAYRQRFVIAYQAGQAPDIWTGGHEEIAWMAAAGYIVPVDEYIQKYWEQYELNDVFDNLWQACTWKGQLWCVPQDTEARPRDGQAGARPRGDAEEPPVPRPAGAGGPHPAGHDGHLLALDPQGRGRGSGALLVRRDLALGRVAAGALPRRAGGPLRGLPLGEHGLHARARAGAGRAPDHPVPPVRLRDHQPEPEPRAGVPAGGHRRGPQGPGGQARH